MEAGICRCRECARKTGKGNRHRKAQAQEKTRMEKSGPEVC